MEPKMYFFHGITKDKRRFTICGVENGGIMNISCALCSLKDNFSRKIGRCISLGRINKMKNVTYKVVFQNNYTETIIDFGVKLNKHDSVFFKKTFEL